MYANREPASEIRRPVLPGGHSKRQAFERYRIHWKTPAKILTERNRGDTHSRGHAGVLRSGCQQKHERKSDGHWTRLGALTKTPTKSDSGCHCSTRNRTENWFTSAANLSKFDLLVLDIIATAPERMSIVLTTNFGFEHWTDVLGPKRLTGTALGRLTHRCVIVETSGECYRLHDSQCRRRTEPKS
ncbi:MAG: ATP-binding protein [Gemmataceae bacterium]|nr:ATP-binding protein [Gemmataceae bacterium]